MIRGFLTGAEFDKVGDAAVRAMFIVDGRIDPTPSAKFGVAGTYGDIVATRDFKTYLRRELTKANIRIWPKARKR